MCATRQRWRCCRRLAATSSSSCAAAAARTAWPQELAALLDTPTTAAGAALSHSAPQGTQHQHLAGVAAGAPRPPVEAGKLQSDLEAARQAAADVASRARAADALLRAVAAALPAWAQRARAEVCRRRSVHNSAQQRAQLGSRATPFALQRDARGGTLCVQAQSAFRGELSRAQAAMSHQAAGWAARGQAAAAGAAQARATAAVYVGAVERGLQTLRHQVRAALAPAPFLEAHHRAPVGERHDSPGGAAPALAPILCVPSLRPLRAT